MNYLNSAIADFLSILEAKKENNVEINAVKLCSVRCIYCPQDDLIDASKSGELNNSNLDQDVFRNVWIIDIPNCRIFWTGYSSLV